MSDINFLSVNSKDQFSELNYGTLASRMNFTLYQDSDEDNVWHKLGGKKDDFFIYDRCGRLTYYLGLPHSNLIYNITERAIHSTYHDNPCGICYNSSDDNVNPDDVTERNDTNVFSVGKCREIKTPDGNEGDRDGLDTGGNESPPHHVEQDPHENHHGMGVDVDQEGDKGMEGVHGMHHGMEDGDTPVGELHHAVVQRTEDKSFGLFSTIKKFFTNFFYGEDVNSTPTVV